MKRIALLLMVLVFAMAAQAGEPTKKHSDKQQWIKEMRQLRTNYVVKHLKLGSEQSEKFAAAYNAMQVDLDKLHKESRQLCKTVQDKGESATNLELEKGAEAMYEMRSKEGAIEMRYFTKFKSILTPRQLFNLKKIEHNFNRELLKRKKEGKK